MACNADVMVHATLRHQCEHFEHSQDDHHVVNAVSTTLVGVHCVRPDAQADREQSAHHLQKDQNVRPGGRVQLPSEMGTSAGLPRGPHQVQRWELYLSDRKIALLPSDCIVHIRHYVKADLGLARTAVNEVQRM